MVFQTTFYITYTQTETLIYPPFPNEQSLHVKNIHHAT